MIHLKLLISCLMLLELCDMYLLSLINCNIQHCITLLCGKRVTTYQMHCLMLLELCDMYLLISVEIITCMHYSALWKHVTLMTTYQMHCSFMVKSSVPAGLESRMVKLFSLFLLALWLHYSLMVGGAWVWLTQVLFTALHNKRLKQEDDRFKWILQIYHVKIS